MKYVSWVLWVVSALCAVYTIWLYRAGQRGVFAMSLNTVTFAINAVTFRYNAKTAEMMKRFRKD